MKNKKGIKCPVCQSTALDDSQYGDELVCVDCLAILDLKGNLVEIDGIRAEVA